MFANFNLRLRMLLMGGYVMSLSVGSVQVLPHTSLPFLFALTFAVYKLSDMFVNRRGLRIKPEVYVVAVFYLYLITAEQFVHDGNIFNAYFISFGLNCVIFFLLADEFYRDTVARDKVMRLYATAVVVVAALVTLKIMTSASQSGRITFLGLNQNELAAALLIAYCWLSVEFMRSKWNATGRGIVLLLPVIVVLNALIVTGTRFALFGVIGVLLLLVFSALLDRNKVRNAVIYVLISVATIGYKIKVFTPMSDRLEPSNVGNNLTDLGGRTPLWRYAVDAFKEAPFVGLGYDGYEKFVVMRETFFGLPHNFPLEMAAIAGVVGIIMITVMGLILSCRIFVWGDRMKIPETLIWSLPVMIILLMLNITDLKLFWFVLAYFITFDFGTRNKTFAAKG